MQLQERWPAPPFPILIRRLDMENFVLAGPESTDNTCMNDEFYVTGGSTSLPTVCGTNSGQHSKTPVIRGKVLENESKLITDRCNAPPSVRGHGSVIELPGGVDSGHRRSFLFPLLFNQGQPG